MTVRILQGDCRERLKELPDQSIHCCVSSPPYFGLRDYGTATWEGGDDSCDHKKPSQPRNGRPLGTFHGGTDDGNAARDAVFKDVCGKCGAARIDRQMGLEATPDEFVAGMVAVFAEVRRVLRDDGTLWLNIGDSYASIAGGYSETGSRGASAVIGAKTQSAVRKGACRKPPEGLKPKDLIGIPWMLAFALRADGWYLRQDIIWSKPNPMPESVRDRCTKAHEYLFLLSKSPRYHFDAEAIAEPVSPSSIARWSQNIEAQAGSERVPGKTNGTMKAVGRKNVSPGAIMAAEPTKGESTFGFGETRNKRSVWEVATQPFSEAHFATFPPALIEPCILAGCPEGGTVLDPFFGAGTTGLVADRHRRDCIGIELNPEYAEIARNRLSNDAGMFAQVLAA